LLRRNPTDAERALWEKLRSDRRFAGKFKRQTPVGRHIPDFVSFEQRTAIELVNPDEGDTVISERALRKAWLEARGYRVCVIEASAIEADIGEALQRLEAAVARQPGG
jgi:tRNA/rRNA methyltransferase